MLPGYAHAIVTPRFWVLSAEDQAVGVLVLIPRDDHLLLENIAVLPDFAGSGLGSQLLAQADLEARALDYRELRLYTHVSMTENVTLYEAKGWAVTLRGQEGGYERAFMSRCLDS